tara:strand:- start:864 stop:1172 length:309 start_codon:yes stop_codon:yes gene_type:complete
MIKNDTNRKGIIYLAMNIIDAMVTSFVLKMGGGELNPVYNTLLRNGFGIFEIKLMILLPLVMVWNVIREQNSEIAIKLLDIGLLLMKTLMLFELVGIAYIYI